MKRRIAGVLICASVAVLLLYPLLSAAENRAAGKGKTEQADARRLKGRWVRPDGGYVLELGEIKKGGSVKASYFNPKPINVHKAQWERKKGKINLVVELRDVNYPGSTYRLVYDPKADRLIGDYFQAVERQTFQIEFLRVPKESSDIQRRKS